MCSRTQPIQAKYQVFIVKCQGCGDWKNGENVMLKWKRCLYFKKKSERLNSAASLTKLYFPDYWF